MLNQNVAIDCTLLPNPRVESGALLGWFFSDHGLRPVNRGHNFVVVFTKSRSCGLCYNRICESVCAMTRSQFILKKTWFLSPKMILCPCSNRALLPPSTCKQNGRMPPLGGHEQVFRPFGATETLLGNLRPKKNFFSTVWILFLPGTPWCYCICMWSRVWTIFFSPYFYV